jgi:hypothetical protein
VSRLPAWRTPLALYVAALVAGALAASRVAFPPTEVSAYVAGVARNLVEGRGLVSDVIWSYAAGPYVLPRPAFDLWQPLPGFLAALPMAVAGPSFAAAQAAFVALGAAIAPLTWWIARDAAARNGLVGRRAATVAAGAGIVAAAFGPFLVAAAGPDSTVPFTVFAVAASAVMPRALDGGRRAGLALGLLLGLAYLSRQEAVWVGLAYVVLLVGRDGGIRAAWRGLRWPVAAGALLVGPWLVRNALTFEDGLIRQTLEYAWLTRNEGVFAYLDRPTLATFLAQGPGGILAHVAGGLVHGLVDVLLVPAFPVGLVGLIAFVGLRRTPALREASPLRALVIGGAITFLVIGLVFPVATLWGTFQHASGPLLVALVVLAGLGLDALLACIRHLRGWSRENAWLAPLATLALTVPIAALAVTLTAAGAASEERRMEAVAAAVDRAEGPVITDHPMWVADALGVPALALPDEPPANIVRLAQEFGAGWLLVLDTRGRYPAVLLDAPSPCLVEEPMTSVEGAHLVRIVPGCTP